MTAVAGVDPSFAATGYAGPDGRTWVLTEKPALGTYERIARVSTRFDRLVGDHEPELAVFEAFGSGPNRNALVRMVELGSALRLVCHGRSIPFVDFAPSTLKAYAAGHGHAEKADMAIAFESRLRLSAIGFGDDEIDALWLRDLGLWLVSDPAAAGPSPDCSDDVVSGIIERAREQLSASAVQTREDR